MISEQNSCRLSIVIATHNAKQVIVTCLDALVEQTDPQLDEIIIADSSSDDTPLIVETAYPTARLLHFDEPLTLPQLRGKAIAVSQGEIIAVLDPYSIVSAGWLDAVLNAHRERPNPVIGGVVDLYNENNQNLLTWAQYINEYGMFMSPANEGEREILPGSNISYKRSVLFDGNTPIHSEFWKTFVNWKTEGAGTDLWFSPSIQVCLWKPIPFANFLITRLDHGRCFAAMRSLHITHIERLARALSTPLLPFLFLFRWGRHYWANKRRRFEFLITLPLQILLFGQWALGEFVGYCFSSGQSCQKLFY